MPHNINSYLNYVLQYYPLTEVLAAEYLLEDFRPDLIDMVLDKLRPEYVRSVQAHHTVFPQSNAMVMFILLCPPF